VGRGSAGGAPFSGGKTDEMGRFGIKNSSRGRRIKRDINKKIPVFRGGSSRRKESEKGVGGHLSCKGGFGGGIKTQRN